MAERSTLPWAGGSNTNSGTKRVLACWDPAEERLPKLRKNSSPPSVDGVGTASALFHGDDGGRGRVDGMLVDTEGERQLWDSQRRATDFQGTSPRANEFPCHMLNGSMLLHGRFAFEKWLVQHRSILDGQRVLELKSGTGALAIFLRKELGVDVTTYDSYDKETEHRIAYNCRVNNLAVLPHIRHTWGDPFPVSRPDWDIIIASDIEPYAEQSANLVKTLSFLLREYKPKAQRVGCTTITNKSGTQIPVKFPVCLISWRQRIDPSILFLGCEQEGLEVQHLGHLVYLIQKKN